MLTNFEAIRTRVHGGTASARDTQELCDEVDRLYSDPKPPAVLALEKAQAAAAAAEDAANRASQATLAAHAEAEAANARAQTAKAVADAAQKVADDRKAMDQAAFDKATAEAVVAQKEATSQAFKEQLGAQ